MEALLVTFGLFAVLLVIWIAIRKRTGVEIKNSDITLVIVPLALWMLVTGRITKLQLGELTIESAFAEATNASVTDQITKLAPLPITEVVIETKGGTQLIPRMIERRIQALSFVIGHGGYWGPAIEEYLEQLVEYPFFNYIVILEQNSGFFALGDAREFSAVLLDSDGEYDASTFAKWLNESNRDGLSRLPGLLTVTGALTDKTSRHEALERMEALDVEILPVVDDAGGFVGVVDRSRLTSSIVIDISKRLAEQ